MDAIEEIINIPRLLDRLNGIVAAGKIYEVMSEIINQSRVEFNYIAQDEMEEEEEADFLQALEEP
jgi:hypothetical protein